MIRLAETHYPQAIRTLGGGVGVQLCLHHMPLVEQGGKMPEIAGSQQVCVAFSPHPQFVESDADEELLFNIP